MDAITNLSDDRLIQSWKSGDEAAAGVLVQRYSFRLIALVASRLHHRYRAEIAPDELVQSAWGSFFEAIKQSRIDAIGQESLWSLLATFARRKLSRSIERLATEKRGGSLTRVPLSDCDVGKLPRATEDQEISEVREFLSQLKASLTEDQFSLVEGLLAGKTQSQMARSLGIHERTIRRRIGQIRRLLVQGPRNDETQPCEPNDLMSLPRVDYKDFVLGRMVGNGAFGKVYRASLQVDGRIVAVKFLRKAFWQIPQARQTFLREIEMASEIHHPGVIRHLGHGDSPHGGIYVVSEWIEGRSIALVENISLERFVGWLRQVCEALQAVHEAGIVHGDLTPNNLLVDGQERIILTDFGFARWSASKTTTALGGTLGYAAPEQIDASFGTISPKTDLYAIGSLIRWFLTKQSSQRLVSRPDTILETLAPHDSDHHKWEGVPPILHEILMITHQRAPAERTGNLAEITRLLGQSVGLGQSVRLGQSVNT